MAAEGTPFTGVLYCGLMMTARGPQVLEFNARFGDPETQAILVRLESDLVDALEACAQGPLVGGALAEIPLRWSPGASACVVASSGGYPGSYKNGFPITGLAAAAHVPGVQVFHAGTALIGGTGANRHSRRARSRRHRCRRLTRPGSRPRLSGHGRDFFEGMYYRRDIGHRALNRDRLAARIAPRLGLISGPSRARYETRCLPPVRHGSPPDKSGFPQSVSSLFLKK